MGEKVPHFHRLGAMGSGPLISKNRPCLMVDVSEQVFHWDAEIPSVRNGCPHQGSTTYCVILARLLTSSASVSHL